MDIFKSAVWRLLRVAASIGIAMGLAAASHQPQLIWLAPVISAISKALRDKGILKDIPV